jgi:hypothetical protein
MSRIRNSVLCGFSACLTLFSAQASAQTIASFGIPVYSLREDGETTSSITGINLGATGTSGVTLNFVLPRDYVNDSEVAVLLFLKSFSVSCSIRFAAAQMTRSRAGQAQINSLDGLTAPNPVINVTSNNIFQRAFRLNPGGAAADQKKGDIFALRLRREGDDPSDTCAQELLVSGIEVRYTAQ